MTTKLTTKQFNLYDTGAPVPIEARAPGSCVVQTAARSTGLISSLVVTAVAPGASVTVTFYEIVQGERRDLKSHTVVDDTAALPFIEKLCISKIHSNVWTEAIVAGGSVTFGVYHTAQDVSLLEETLADTGSIPVTQDIGAPFHAYDTETSASGSEEEVLSFTVGTGVTRRITQVIGTACVEGVFELRVQGGDTLAVFVTTPSNATVSFKFEPSKPISSGSVVELVFTANDDQDPSTVHGFVMGYEL